MHRICGIIFALALPLATAAAQDTATVTSGARVRVSTATRQATGTLESIDGTTIVVRRSNGTTVDFRRESGTRLDVSAGPGMCSPGHRGSCIALGFLGGGVVGVGVGAILVSDCNDELCPLLYLITVPAGALVGTVVGAVIGGEHWKRAELPAMASVAPNAAGGVRVGVRLRF